MSDAVLIVVVPSAITTIGLIVVAYLNTRQNRKISEKVDGYHKEVNGKMGELLTTTKALGNAEGKAQEKAKGKK
jgi:hypothetical protein